MRKSVRNIVFLIAGLVILMHNITPHLHHGELSDQEHIRAHCEADDLFDWVSLGFHNDLGGGHLECFSEIENVELNPHLDFLIPDHLLFSLITTPDTVRYFPEEVVPENAPDLPDIFRHFYHSLDIANRPPPFIFS